MAMDRIFEFELEMKLIGFLFFGRLFAVYLQLKGRNSVTFPAKIQQWRNGALLFPKLFLMKQFLSMSKFCSNIRIKLKTFGLSRNNQIKSFFRRNDAL